MRRQQTRRRQRPHGGGRKARARRPHRALARALSSSTVDVRGSPPALRPWAATCGLWIGTLKRCEPAHSIQPSSPDGAALC